MKNSNLKFSFCTVLFLVNFTLAKSQDTIKLSINSLENKLESQSRILKAQKYAIESAKGQINQAGIWSNPNLNIQQPIYNSTTKNYFPLGSNGSLALDLNQSFDISRKRSKKVNIETLNTAISENQYYSILRDLKLELRTNSVNIYFAKQGLELYNQEIESLKRLVAAYTIQYKRGNVSLTELTRLKALLLQLQNEKINIVSDYNNFNSRLNVILSNEKSENYSPIINLDSVVNLDISKFLNSLIQIALENREDLKAGNNVLKINEENVKLQNSIALPELVLGLHYDQAGNYIPKYKALSLGFDLPFFNRNQGNIQSAESQLEQSKLQYEQQKNQISSELNATLKTLQNTEELYKNFDESITSDYEKMISGILANFEKKNLSLIEFIDLFESYKNTKLQYLELSKRRLLSYEQINYVVGKSLFNY